MKFEDEITAENNRSQYKQLKSDAQRINSQLAAWVGTHTSLRESVEAEKQAELDTKKAQFVQMLRTTLGL